MLRFQSWRDDQYNWFQKQYGSKGANKDGSAAFRWGTYRNKSKDNISYCNFKWFLVRYPCELLLRFDTVTSLS